MSNRALNDAESTAREALDQARERVDNLQQDAKERVSDIREEAEERTSGIRGQAADFARDTAVDAQAKAQWQTTKALRKAENAPDIVYLAAVMASMAVSLALLMRKRRSMSLFIGLWPVTILNIAMLLKNRRVSDEVTRIPSVVDVKDELLAE